MRTLSQFKLQQINLHLRTGGLVAYPTEAVYGLGCDPDNELAVRSLLALKSRSQSKGLILIASELQQLSPYLKPLTSEITERLDNTWPGPVTWLLTASNTTPKWLTGNHTTLACRVSSHPLVQQLCKAFGGALVSTSANPADRSPCRTAILVRKQFYQANQLMVISGAVGDLKQPTQIYDAITNQRLR
jgi:tRNA threonylcarbamoyl adenosine modification protein (Sua5/YciO/YrdC/YwlC family)